MGSLGITQDRKTSTARSRILSSLINTRNGKAKTDTTSEEDRAIYALKHTVRDTLGAAWLGGILLIIVTSLRLNSKFQFFRRRNPFFHTLSGPTPPSASVLTGSDTYAQMCNCC
jgi:hypothetical protein